MLPPLNVKIAADASGFNAAIDDIARGLNGLDGKIKSASDKIKAFGASTQSLGKRMLPVSAGVSAIGAGMIALVQGTANAGFEISNMASISGTTAEEFQRLAAGARAVGIDGEKLSDIYKDMNDRVGDFMATGGGPMADFFENIAPQVGVTADEFARLSGPEAMQLYVDSLEAAGASQQDMTFYMEALAGDAAKLIPLLADGGAEMTRLGDAAAEAGGIMSDEAIAASRDYSEQLLTLQDSLSGAGREIGSALLPVAIELAGTLRDTVVPAIVSMAESVGDAINWFGQLPDGVQAAAGIIAGAFAVGGPALMAIGSAIKIVGSLAALFSPAGLIIGGLLAAAAVWAKWGDDIKAFSKDAFDFIVEKGKAFLDFYLSIPGKMLQIGRDILAKLIQGIKEGIGGLAEIGAAIRDGLVNGIKNAGASIWEAAKGLGRAAIGGSKEALESNSPSLAMMRVGQDVGNGLILGMNASRPMVAAEAAAMAGDIKAAFGQATPEMEGMGGEGEGGIGAPAIEGEGDGPSGFFEIGAAMVGGLRDGILSMAGGAIGAAKGVADGVKVAMADMNDGTTASAFDMASGVVGALGQMFKGSKPIAMAQALINTFQGITEALKLPFPQSLVAAAKVAAQGFAAVKGIQSARPGGSTSVGGAASASGAGVQSAPQTQRIVFDVQNASGGMVPSSTLESFADMVNQAADAGYLANVQFQGV